MMGFFASSSTRVAAATLRASPDGRVAFTGLYWSAIWSATSATATSAGISTMTGPPRPIFKRLKARRMPSPTPCEHAMRALRREAKRLAAELFCDEVPAERGVMGSAVGVAMAALDRLGIEHRARAAGFEQAIDRADAEPRDEGLVPTVADAVELAEPFPARRPVEHLADVLPMERPRRVHFGRGLGQPELERDRIRRAARAGPALGPRGELVDGALGD